MANILGDKQSLSGRIHENGKEWRYSWLCRVTRGSLGSFACPFRWNERQCSELLDLFKGDQIVIRPPLSVLSLLSINPFYRHRIGSDYYASIGWRIFIISWDYSNCGRYSDRGIYFTVNVYFLLQMSLLVVCWMSAIWNLWILAG